MFHLSKIKFSLIFSIIFITANSAAMENGNENGLNKLTRQLSTIEISDKPTFKKGKKPNHAKKMMKKCVRDMAEAKQMDLNDGLTPVKQKLSEVHDLAKKNHFKRQTLRARFVLDKLAITGKISNSN